MAFRLPRFWMPRTKASKAAVAGGGVIAAAIAIATPFVGGWEGKRNAAYRDIVGVVTVCYGETRGVKITDRHSDAECNAMLARGLGEFTEKIAACVDISKLPPKTLAAHISTAYNIGWPGWCKSSMARDIRAGKLAQSCDSLLRWNKGKVNGRLQVIRGLDNRRKAERRLCREGLGLPA